MGVELDKSDFYINFDGRSNLTIGEITETLIRVEYVYNLLAFMDHEFFPSKDEKAKKAIDLENLAYQITGIRSSDDITGAFVNTRRLRDTLENYTQLHVQQITLGSIKLSVAGIAKVITALAEVFDPTKRAERREDLRHKQVMNVAKEREEACKLALKQLKTSQEILTIEGKFRERLINAGYSETEAVAASKQLLSEVAGSMRFLESRNIDVKLISSTQENDQEE